MNLNELNQIEEGIFSAIKDRFQQGGYQNTVQDIFIKDFVQDALTSLNNGVKGGLINPDPKATVATNATTSSASGTNSSATQQGTAPQAPSGNQAAPASSTAAPQQYAGKIAPNAGPATKPAAPASPFTTPTLNQPKTTVNTTPNAKSAPGAITTGGAGIKTKESAYDKMNRVFESIININEAAELKTVSDFMMDWFTQYMQGVNWQSSQAIIKDKLDKMQSEYPSNVKQNLTDLARVALALSKTGTPAGAPQEFAQAKKNLAGDVNDIRAALDGLAKSNPQIFNELLKSLRPVAVK